MGEMKLTKIACLPCKAKRELTVLMTADDKKIVCPVCGYGKWRRKNGKS